MIPATAVDYPRGATASTSRVVHVHHRDARVAVVLERTAFHPVDAGWPDQPADRGVLRTAEGVVHPILDAVVAATQGDELMLGADIPVRTGTEGWTFVVAHLLDGAAPSLPAVGDHVTVEADAGYRTALSMGHTACHLASLALDAALAGAWRKEVPRDALGAPGFDALAIEESRIVEHGSHDRYRIGKSLRRRGFDPVALDDLARIEAHANGLLADWVASGAPVRIETDGPALADRRRWVCDLPGRAARIPCGGTHIDALSRVSAISVTLATAAADGGLELTMRTTAEPRA